MAPLSDEQFNQIRDERKEQITLAGIKVFARKGISGTKISMIAAEAGVSHGLLYHYFKSKEELLHYCLQEAKVEGLALFEQIKNHTGTPLDKISFFTKTALMEGNSDIFIITELASRSDEVPERTKTMIKDVFHGYYELLLPIFVEGQTLGELVQGDTKELVEDYMAVISGLLTEGVKWEEERLDEKVAFLLRLIKN